MNNIFVKYCLVTLLLCTLLLGCGREETSLVEESTQYDGVETLVEKEKTTSKVADEQEEKVEDENVEEALLNNAYFEEYEQQYLNGTTYNPVFKNRCFYIDGVRVQMPNSIREIEELFNTRFVNGMTIARNYTYCVLIDEYNRGILVRLSREGTALFKSGEIDEVKDLPILSIAIHEDDSKFKIDGVQYQSLLRLYNVTFEDVNESVNDFGYIKYKEDSLNVYVYVPEELYVYHMFLKGEIPDTIYVSGEVPFDAKHEGDDFYQSYYSDYDYDAVYEYGFVSIDTHYGNYELFVVENEYADGFLYAYDCDSKCIIQMDSSSINTPETYSVEDIGEKISYLIMDEYRSAD